MAAWQPLRALPDPWCRPQGGMSLIPLYTSLPRFPGCGLGVVGKVWGVVWGVWGGWVGQGRYSGRCQMAFPLVAPGSLAATLQQHGCLATLTSVGRPVTYSALWHVAWPPPDPRVLPILCHIPLYTPQGVSRGRVWETWVGSGDLPGSQVGRVCVPESLSQKGRFSATALRGHLRPTSATRRA
jgi:hypothetical protein